MTAENSSGNKCWHLQEEWHESEMSFEQFAENHVGCSVDELYKIFDKADVHGSNARH